MVTEWQIGNNVQNRWVVKDKHEGGFGIVYIVNDKKLGRELAAKTFHNKFLPDEQSKERFRQECSSWINLNTGKYKEKLDGRSVFGSVDTRRSQYIVDALFVENIDDRPYLFMEYVGGGDLEEKIKIGYLKQDLISILRYAIQFCEGILYAYANGIIVHRDIKPKNCLITTNNILKVTDFGLAKCLGEPILNENVVTFPYMAPEQSRHSKDVDRSADIYSFGIMLYEMISGQLPFHGIVPHFP